MNHQTEWELRMIQVTLIGTTMDIMGSCRWLGKLLFIGAQPILYCDFSSFFSETPVLHFAVLGVGFIIFWAKPAPRLAVNGTCSMADIERQVPNRRE